MSRRNRSTATKPTGDGRSPRRDQPGAERTGRRAPALAAVGLAGLVLAGGLGYLAQAGPDPGTAPVGASGALPPGQFPEPGVEHVHGLGVDPADGVLYAATHFGLLRLPDGGGVTRVANRYQDTMGFTVVGPGTFLGSGHPDPREDHPPRLGLIESTDAGQTWQPLSLRGEADFHALHAAHGNVYGYEAGSGRFMVSADRRRWESRSELPMRDFAVSPDDAETVLATAERGLVRSADGGRTWQPVGGAPTLTVLWWGQAAGLYGLAPDGAVHHSRDGGASWTRRGGVDGAPEAVTVDARGGRETLYVAVSGRGVAQSTDGGATFTTRYAG